MARKSDPLAFGGLALLTLIWSFSWIAMKQVTSYIGAFDFTALRCIFGAVVLWIVMLIRGKALKPTPFGYTLAIALLQTCGMVGLAQWALMSGGAGKVAILSYTMPFWVVVMAALFLGERMRRWQYIAIGGGMRGPDTRTSALATRLYLPEKRLAGDPLRRELGGRCDRREAYVYPVSAG